jgi:hypothetical protein
MAIGSSHVNPAVILVFWPSSIVGLSDPSALSDKLIVAISEFGGDFLLYGVVGALIGCASGEILGRDIHTR